MTGDQLLVGIITIMLAAGAFAAALGPWNWPYRFKLPNVIASRYGKHAARTFYIVAGVGLMLLGFAILSGIRPSYVSTPPAQTQN